MFFRIAWLGLSAVFLATTGVWAETDPPFIAGVAPHQRPKDAPVITEVEKGADWYASALHGVESPYPYSLRFLEDQGNWFNPFQKPGMTGPYDIRGWH